MHVPKSGGTLIRNYLKMQVGDKEELTWCGQGYEGSQFNKLYICAQGTELADTQRSLYVDQFFSECNVFSSHIDFSTIQLLRKSHSPYNLFTFTLVRDPIEQLISLFYHLKFIGKVANLGSLDTFLTHHPHWQNKLTSMLVNRVLGECFEDEEANKQVR